MSVVQAKAERAATAQAIADLTAAAADELEAAKRTWSEGESLRREKWLDRKTHEIRELTMRGLEPEIERIMEKHSADVAADDSAHSDALLSMRRVFQLRCSEAAAAAAARVKEEGESRKRAAVAAGVTRRQQLIEEHSQQLQRLRGKLEEEGAALRGWQGEELQKLEDAAAAQEERARFVCLLMSGSTDVATAHML
jgi:5-azacytidine-induced protein 1